MKKKSLYSFRYCRDHSRRPERDLCLHGLSYFCGLRAQEIARLKLRDVTDAAGRLADKLEVTRHAAKYGRPRVLPMPREVKDALSAYLRKYPIKNGNLFFNQFGQPLTSGAVQKQLARIGRAADSTSRHILVGERASRWRPARHISSADVCGTFSCWPATPILRPPKPT